MNRRELLKNIGATTVAGAVALHMRHARATLGLLGGAASVVSAFKFVGAADGFAPDSSGGIPVYQNGMLNARGFMTTGNASVFTTLDSNGWPTTDFQTYLIELQNWSTTPSWAHVNDSLNPWKCGYTSKNGGTETITGINATISNKVVSSNAVTFDLVPTNGASGFSITGTTGGVTSVFANLPAYPTGSGTFTNEIVSLLGNCGTVRALDWSNSLFASATVTSTNRHTPSNCHSKSWSTNSITTDINGTNVSTPDGFPFEDFVSLCNAAKADCWWNFALNGDSSYVSALASYAAANLSGVLTGELGNELWNGVGIGQQGGFQQAVAAYIVANTGKLDYDTPCYFTGTANGTTTVTGTIPATATAGFEIVGPNVPAGTKISTVNAGTSMVLSNSIPAGSGTFAYATTNTEYRYVWERMYQIALAFQTAYGASFSSKVKLAIAWQSGTTLLSMIHQGAGYLAHAYPTATVASVFGAFSSAPYETRNNTNVPGDGVNHVNETGDSVATIQSQLTANGNYIAYNSYLENGAIYAMHYGIGFWMYETGWEIAGETSAADYGPAITDSGMQSVVTSYLQNLGNSGASRGCWTAFSINNTSTPAVDPGYGLATDYATFESSGSPRLSGIQSVNNSGISYTRNVVSGSGSVIDCINYADNVSAKSATYPYFGQLNGYNQAPYYSSGGYLGYIVNCTKPGTYTVVGTFDTTATGTTNFEWGNPQNAATITTGVAIPNGTAVTATLGTVTLVEGPNYVLLGNGSTQTAIVPKSLTFN